MADASVLTKSQLSFLNAKLQGLKTGEAPKTPVQTRRATIPELGVIFFSGVANGCAPYDLLLDVAKFADAQGFKAIWTPERHFTEVGGAYPNPATLAAALATVTRNVRLRAGSINLPLHDPIRVAEEWSVVDNLSNGRVDLAVAPGWHVRDFVLKPENFAGKFDILNEYRDQLRRMWQGEPIEKTDANGDIQAIVTYPRPVQKTLPLWLTTSQKEDAWRFAGENNFNVLSALINFGPKDLEKRIRIYREARASAGLNPESGVVSLMLHTYVDEDPRRAVERVRPALTDYLKSFVTQHQTANTSADDKVKTLNSLGEDSDDFVDMVFTRYVKTSSLIGDAEQAESVLANFKAMGVDEVACLVDFGLKKEEVLGSLRLLSGLMRSQR
ncbi:LLM class flavin-dependent oxidoreductase [Noviherbaspirillum cavernae]|uniref:LLM class flavin-dependent oxidoreductase n=1 Tax=Noviherbaspirillum cavernae TaxID=2320862 RepID=A0A418X255_9BURK|nr:MupA/Atu3671 family FMN-dependent luciferase-like monooxygenase [Noviherbaspirillum cavernae]RJG06515.1 LLM class flavin-dependent oxidoreductase [Noviherbaspirillum cavernae]